MATAANISNFKLKLGQADSPETYNDVEEVLSITGFGKTNDLLDVTNFDSPAGTKEFIAGLADGAEITAECNYIGGTEQDALRTAIDAGSTRNFQIVNTNQSPSETFAFAAVCLSWTIEPSPTEQNRISFGLKITGAIT